MANDTNEGQTTNISRRSMLAAAGAAGVSVAGMAAKPALGAVPTSAVPWDGVLTTPPEAIVKTTNGPIRGFRRNEIYIFKAVPYGDDPSGENRFTRAKPPKPWKETRSCLAYGPACPQPARDWSNNEMAFVADWNDGYSSENCLTLNIWSANLDSQANRPVLVWLHGGGYTTGSAHELPAYEGARLAARRSVVVTVNHRLNAFGFMDLSHLGDERFGQSGNAGMLDIVLALRWVRDNIATFGGDPKRVTIFGQSGGGGKVSALMAMPEGKGLFHRAVVMSGSFPPGRSQESARKLTDAIMRQLNLAPNDVAGLQRVAIPQLLSATDTAQKELRGGGPPPARGTARGGTLAAIPGFSPVADGQVLLARAWRDGAPELSAGVPMIIGNVRDEFKLSTVVYDEAALEKRVNDTYRESAPKVLGALKQEFPKLSTNAQGGVVGGMPMRIGALDQCSKKATLAGSAPVFSYWFIYAAPLLDDRVGVPHCTDITYAFDNTLLCDQLTGNTPTARRIAEVMSKSLVRFAEVGDPSLPELNWPKYAPEEKATMVFDTQIAVKKNPAGRIIEAMQAES